MILVFRRRSRMRGAFATLASLTMAMLSLAACSGNGALPGVSSSSAAVPSSNRKAKATLTIRWTSAKKKNDLGAASQRRPHFISPSAKSIEIGVASEKSSSKYATTIVNKPKSGTTSTISIDAPIGNDAFAFGVFDKPNAGGTEIGGAQLFQKIVAAKANVLKVTLDGYVDGAKLTYNSPFLVSKPDAGGQPNFTLIGTAPVTVTLVVTDADGNVIVPPGTAPVATLSSTQPSLVTVKHSKSNAYVVQAIAPNPTGIVTGLKAQASSGAGGLEQFETQFPLTEEAAIYAAYGAGGAAGVTVFDQQGHAYTSSGFPGLNTPVAMTWDPTDRLVLVADAGNGGTLLAFDGSGNPAKGWTPPAVPGISGVAYNPDTKAIYVTSTAGGGAVKAFNARGTAIVLSPGAFGGLNTPVGIAYNSSAAVNVAQGTDDVNEFYVIDKPAAGAASIAAYLANGKPAAVPSHALGSNVPTGISALLVDQYGAGGMGAYITTTSNAVDLYSDSSTGDVRLETVVSDSGLNDPLAIANNPLANYTVGQGGGSKPPISGPQPVLFYVANGSGGLIAIDGNYQQDASTTFAPPTGANNFVALTMTY